MEGIGESVLDSEVDDIRAFIARLEAAHPDVSAKALDRGVDVALGRAVSDVSGAGSRPTAKRDNTASVPAGGWYRNLVKRLPPILTASEARQAARDVELGIYASHLLETLRPGAVTRGFIRDLKTIAEEGRLAREILTVSNLRLVHHWSSWVSEVYGPDWAEDAFQAGCLGLIRGVDGWDYTKGFAFSTYASWHIRQQIQRWRMNETSLIRVPVHVYERMKDGGEGLSVELREAADRAFKVRLLEDLTDLESVLWEDGGVGSVVEDSSIRQIVHLLFAALTSREIDVLSYRFGFRTGGEPLTLDEIGKIFGLTRERIRQIEKAALKKLVELRVSDPRDSV